MGYTRIVILRAVYTECPRRNVPDFGRVFLMVKYTDITQNIYVQSCIMFQRGVCSVVLKI
jgi:hypothetical protein